MDAAPSTGARRPRASPSRRPPAPPRVQRAPLGLALVAALDEPLVVSSAARSSPFQRPRSDSTLSSDTFDGIYALGDDDVGSVDVDDVDMDDLSGLEQDPFRPSALLDTTLEAEYGRASDLERLLLSNDLIHEPSAACDRLHHVQVDDDEASDVLAHLAQLDAQHQLQVKPPQDRGNGICALVPHGGGRLVVQAGATGSGGGVARELLPPRGEATTRHVHKRTFGERAASFRFASSGRSPRTTSPVKVGAVKSIATLAATTTNTSCRSKATAKPNATPPRRARSLFRETAEDIAGRLRVDIEQENASPEPSTADHTMDDAETESATEMPPIPTDEEVQLKLEPGVAVAQTPVRCDVPTEPLGSFQTPQRRGSSSITPVFLTPTVSSISTCADAATGASLSPAPTFEKVAVVHAKDTPGKVDKFEWTIRPSHRPTMTSDSVGPPTTPQEQLPPPYLRDASDATPKRRVLHSSTFGSFARSFSFTTP